jgi:hypothetical protein
VTRYAFDEVRSALLDHWGYELYRGGKDRVDGKHDGRWDVTHSRSGYILRGTFPGYRGLRYQRFRSLLDVVRACGLTDVISKKRRGANA